MYARLARARFRPERSEEVIQIAQESLETYRRAHGFKGVTYLYDRASGWGFALSQWETAADAEAVVAQLRPTVAAFAAHGVDGGQAAPDVAGPLPIFEVVAQA